MTSITRRLFLSLAALLAPGTAIAHHGWGSYDTSKPFTLTGKIMKSTYENPHCEIEMEVDGKHWHFCWRRRSACSRAAPRLSLSRSARPAPCSAIPTPASRTRRGSNISLSTASASSCGRPAWNSSRRRSFWPCRKARWASDAQLARALSRVEILHIIGFVVLVGSIVALDLRLLGLGRAIPIQPMAQLLLPFVAVRFLLAISMGFLLFSADASHVVRNPAFRAKAVLIALALITVVIAHAGPWRRIASWALKRRSARRSLRLLRCCCGSAWSAPDA